jgi:hypothetical protein
MTAPWSFKTVPLSPSHFAAARAPPPCQEASSRSSGAAPPLTLDGIPPEQATTDCLEVKKKLTVARMSRHLFVLIEPEMRMPASATPISPTRRRASCRVQRWHCCSALLRGCNLSCPSLAQWSRLDQEYPFDLIKSGS